MEQVMEDVCLWVVSAIPLVIGVWGCVEMRGASGQNDLSDKVKTGLYSGDHVHSVSRTDWA